MLQKNAPPSRPVTGPVFSFAPSTVGATPLIARGLAQTSVLLRSAISRRDLASWTQPIPSMRRIDASCQ